MVEQLHTKRHSWSERREPTGATSSRNRYPLPEHAVCCGAAHRQKPLSSAADYGSRLIKSRPFRTPRVTFTSSQFSYAGTKLHRHLTEWVSYAGVSSQHSHPPPSKPTVLRCHPRFSLSPCPFNPTRSHATGRSTELKREMLNRQQNKLHQRTTRRL